MYCTINFIHCKIVYMNITAGKFKGQKITAPDEKITRPTLSKVRMSVFNTLQALIDFEGKSFLDMYAGSGIMALEAISRGFTKAYAIEKHPKVISVIKNNYKKYINYDFELRLIQGDSLKIVKNFDENFDVIYIDPPYFSGVYEQSLDAVKTITNGIVILEHVTEMNFRDYEIIKQKKYGDKFVTFLKYNL